MSIVIFLIILSVLVIVHELGHFLSARLSGVRVDEFGLGYPPRAAKLFRRKGTDFTLNWLPFGGFVKIFGEDPNEGNLTSPDSFQKKNRGIQAIILAAGVIFNIIFAWILISLGLMAGLPAPVGTLPIEHPQTVITTVLPGSPAEQAGLKSGDAILSIKGTGLSPEEAARVISQASGPLQFEIKRGDAISYPTIEPHTGVIAGQKAIGIAMEVIGTAKLSFVRSLIEGAKLTYQLTVSTAKALVGFFHEALIGKANLSEVTGPVGLVGLVGDARQLGLGYLLSFTALISLNLAIINLLPFPALDGGRLVFVLMEAVTRKKVPAKIFNAINAAGFAILIFLMILVTLHDVRVIL